MRLFVTGDVNFSSNFISSSAQQRPGGDQRLKDQQHFGLRCRLYVMDQRENGGISFSYMRFCGLAYV